MKGPSLRQPIGAGSVGPRWVTRAAKGVRKAVYAKSKEEAAKKLRTVLAARDRGQVIPTGKQTFGQFLNRWLEDVVRPSARPLTFASYETQVRVHISPELGKIRLDQLSPQSVQEYLNLKRKDGLSPRTVQYQRTVLRRALGQAVKWDLAARNAAALTSAPHVPKTAVNPFSLDEVKTFLKAVEHEPLQAAFVVAATAALRRGEVLGLRWSDVELERGQLQVCGALQRVGEKLQLTARRSQREVAS